MCQTQTIHRLSLKGDLVSVSGDGNVIVIVDIGLNALTILKKSGSAFDEIKVRNANVWIPSTIHHQIWKSENMKNFKPQLTYDG